MDEYEFMNTNVSSKFTPKTIPQSKLKAFQIGAMNTVKRVLSKREEEERKRKEDLERTAQVFEEFVETFEGDKNRISKTWVKGDVYKDGVKVEQSKRELYKPAARSSKLAELAATFDSTKKEKEEKKERISIGFKRDGTSKRKTNLEAFKEELKNIQNERAQRHKLKEQCLPQKKYHNDSPILEQHSIPEPSIAVALPSDEMNKSGSYPTVQDDETSTNIYLGNINPQTKENELAEIFGRFGPLASVKIMWPRDEEQRAKNRNCGFVAYMNRKDAERAMHKMQGREIANFEQKLGWGKSVPIPPYPVYIPPSMIELTLPPPITGLPFNAQPPKNADNFLMDENRLNRLEECIVKVVVPTDRHLIQIIHRVIEFVVREGPMFEALIMNREMNNQQYRFLFENQSPEHIYYRWKLFSILQGDTPYQWQTNEFRMFKGGSLWQPPPLNPWTKGMSSDMVEKSVSTVPIPIEENKDIMKKGLLNEDEIEQFEEILHRITPERSSIGEAMIWCIDHAESALQICEFISDSLSLTTTIPAKKLARLYLINDILHNCAARANASFFRTYMEPYLSKIVENLKKTHQSIESRLKAEQFKTRVINCLKAWEDWAVYHQEDIINFQNIFLGLVTIEDSKPEETNELDGAPLDEGISGKTISLVKYDSDDIDGSSIEDQPIKITNKESGAEKPKGFQKSSWSEVDKSQLKDQAVTTSKWELFDDDNDTSPAINCEEGELDEELDGLPMEDDENSVVSSNNSKKNSSLVSVVNEEKRQRLREIELKVVKYSDDLECNRRQIKSGSTISQQVEEYRQKLLEKETTKNYTTVKSYSPSISEGSRRSRSKSPLRRKKRYSRSRSPKRKSPSYERERNRTSSNHSKHKHKKGRR